MRMLLLVATCFVCAGAFAQDPLASSVPLSATGRAQPASEQASEVAAKALLGWMSAQGVAGVVQPRSMVRWTDWPAGALTMLARPISAEQVRQRMVVWVDVRAGERFLRSIPVRVEVAVSLASAAQPAREEPRAPTDVAQPAAAFADQAIAVSRGEWAALRTREGAVLLEGRVEVLQDGRSGDRIRVRQQGGTGIVLARVVGRGQLELAP